MTERETSQDIDAIAAAWVAREDRAPLSGDDLAALNRWLEGDPRRAGALLRAKAVMTRSESAAALGAGYDPERFCERTVGPTDRGLSRRSMLALGGGVAATVAAGSLVGVGLLAPKAYATERGEIRLTPLADGSTVMLNTATKVKVRYDRDRRHVTLVEGEAYFTVLPDPDRPFVVQADGRTFSTDGGAFRIRKLKGAPIDVLVQQGRLDLVDPDRRSATLGANTRLVLDDPIRGKTTAPAVQLVAPEEVTRALAWREGKIAFEGETLAVAAAAFARYSDTRIVIEDPRLARETITGLFAANDPTGFARAVAGVFGASAEARDGVVVLSASEAGQ